MRDISKRLKNIEKKLNLNEKPEIIKLMMFGGELLPDRKEGNITYHFEMYNKKVKK